MDIYDYLKENLSINYETQTLLFAVVTNTNARNWMYPVQ